MPQVPKPRREHFKADDILSLVQTHLPSWTRACEAADADAIAVHESEFGSSAAELLLFACAIKFAAQKGKNVYVTCGHSDARLGIASRVDANITIYHETNRSKAKSSGASSKRRGAWTVN